MTAFRADRRPPSPSLADATDPDAPSVPVWTAESARTVAVTPAAPAPPAPANGPRVFRAVVPAQPSRASGVRRMVAGQLAHCPLSEELLDNAVLATDELFANAVRHGSRGPADTVTISVEYTGHGVRVTIADRSTELPRHCTAGTAEESGRGLAIVAVLTDDWGVLPPEPGERGKRVWFSLDVRAEP
ncbi:ATP-binding protein [Streptomyces beigongshangae]|uniref:ATP-binding protein n=1 Tax=Streptomyces beigongshangae TaxID=2841597 RepID=UPI001C850F19|nr:ATP-binding protein [Streptomyces sp. REN17]